MDLSEGIDSSFQLLILGGELCDSIWADVSKSLSAPLSVIDLQVGGPWARDGYHTLPGAAMMRVYERVTTPH